MNTTKNQVDLTYQACRRLSIAMGEYRNARSAWDNRHLVDHEAKTVLFNQVLTTMHEARRLHDEYMALESTLNQMGGMKCLT